ncbi:MAG: hypothetical protein V4714_10805 [Bacteroidota bacterium]
MKTEFLNLKQKAFLMDRMQEGDIEAIDRAIKEIDRLEQVIKNYELQIEQVVNAYQSNYCKKPD